MEPFEDTIKLYYNTEREKMAMPEYGRNVFHRTCILHTNRRWPCFTVRKIANLPDSTCRR